MEEKKRACVYTRVSTERQGADDKVSLAEQERICKMLAEIRGYECVGTYTDNGLSGRTMKRPALQQMLDDASAKKMDVVIAYKLDRLSRKQLHALLIIEDLKENGIGFVSAKEPDMDTSTPMGKAVVGIMAVFAELEADTIAQRTKMGRDAKAEQGKYVGGKPPLGYELVDGKFAIVPEEAEIVRLVFALRAAGNTYIGITDYLNDHGYRTKKGNKFQFSAVRTILDNESTYRGFYKFGEHVTANAHEPILVGKRIKGIKA